MFYAGLGWSVVPAHKVIRIDGGALACSCPAGVECVSKGKHPAVGWTRWQKERADEVQIRLWFTGAFSEYGVGIITGAISRMFVVDIDEAPGKDGGATIHNLQMIYGDLPPTVTARTGGGGRHLVYLHPCDGTWINTAKNVFGPGVDVRGDGGFIVTAPSMHESGRYYLWDEAGHPKTTAIVAPPAWLAELAETPPPQAGVARGPSTGTGEIVRDAWGKVIDGRERHMIGIICGVIAATKQETGALPTVDAVLSEAWPTYERTTKARGKSLDDDNRGVALMRQRAAHFLRRAETGKWKVEAKPKGPFEAAANATLDYDPETGEILTPRQEPDSGGTERDMRLILSMAEVDALPAPVWLIANIMPSASLVVPYGQPKSGKTFIILSAALHIAAGLPWFGNDVRQGAVVYIAGEGVGGLSVRLRAMRSRYGIPVEAPLWVVRRAVNFRLETEVAGLVTLVTQTVRGLSVALVVIDTLARAMPGADENSAQDVGIVLAGCDAVRDALNCTVVAVHHSGKDEARGARGTSALRGAWDAAYDIKATGQSVTLTVVDQKEAEAGQVLRFNMEKVPVGIGRSSLVPVADETPEADRPMSQREVSGNAGMMLRVLREAMASPQSAVLPPFPGLPSGTIRGVSVETWRRGVYEKMPGVEPAARRQAFGRGLQTLMQRDLINVKDPWVWLCDRNEA